MREGTLQTLKSPPYIYYVIATYTMFDFDPQKDYYKILGVAETASEDEIKKAFRKQAMQHHPDKGGDQEECKKINEAYQVIGDTQKKQQYDAMKNGNYGG